MRKPDDIPQDAWSNAERHLAAYSYLLSSTEIVARAMIAERDRCLLRVAEQRCERGTPWDLAIVTAMNAIKPGSAVFVSPADQASREASSSPASLDAPKPSNDDFRAVPVIGEVS